MLKQAYDGFNRALAGEDFGPIFERHFDPDFEYTGPPEVPEPGPYRGYEEVQAFIRFFSEPFDEVRLEIEDLRGARGGVIYRQRTEVTGGGSGIDIGDRSWAVARIRGGRLLSVVEDYSRDGALKRAGLD